MSQYQDAQMILQFYDLRRESRLREARAFILGRFKAKNVAEFHELCPPGSEENAFFRQVLTYWDMVSAIVKRDVLEKELFYETNGEITAVWEKVKHLIPELRTEFGNQAFLENFEEVAKLREAYLNVKAPGYLKSMRERLGA
jgi:hypothetical protein